MKRLEITYKNCVNNSEKSIITDLTDNDYKKLLTEKSLNGLMFISEHGDFSIIPSLITNIKEI